MLKIGILGAIGAGKSTAVELLSKKFKSLNISLENVDENILLSKYYKEPKKYCFQLQKNFLEEKVNEYSTLFSKNKNFIIDSPFYSGASFVEMNYSEGNLTPDEYNLYKMLNKYYLKVCEPLDLLIYLDCPSSILLKRIKKRGRCCESSINLEYLNRLSEEHYKILDEALWRDKTLVRIIDYSNLTKGYKYLEKLIDNFLSKNQI